LIHQIFADLNAIGRREQSKIDSSDVSCEIARNATALVRFINVT